MSDAPDQPDYRSTVFLPKTDFPMKAGLPQKEPAILARWIEQDIYGQVRNARAGREKFILHDGPPYANGDIHIGHALDRTLKDMVIRTQTLLGKDAPFVPGWDCHGLPIEWKIEEQYRKKKLNKDEVPVREFRAECRGYAQHWVDVQREQLRRLGTLADWDHPYLTMDYSSEATIVGELMKFAESGQIYRGAKPVMWSPVEKTALAEAEIEYEDIVSTQIDVAFEIVESAIPELIGAYAVIWTTTPWTIPVNQAIAYGNDVEYTLIEEGKRRFLVAADLSEPFSVRVERSRDTLAQRPSTSLGTNGLVWRGKGSDLVGTIVRHPMHRLGGFFAKPRPLVPGDHVTTDAGTGLVHMAPDHGEEDFLACKAVGIDPVFAVNDAGFYRDDWLWLGGQGSVINNKFNSVEGPILTDLAATGQLLSAGDFTHSYPHSWRSKAKVIYRCTPQWFIAMDKPLGHLPAETPAELRWDNEGGAPLSVPRPSAGEGQRSEAEQGEGPLSPTPPPQRGEGQASPTLRSTALNAIADTRFVPEKGRNRLASMVEDRPDWVISRQRAWGVPIALFVERKTGELLVDPEVNQRIVAAIAAEGVDAWDPSRAQDYLGSGRNADDYEMVGDILDVWFDSGSTHVFTLESGRWPDQRWPADLYLEGSDQHRGWFQSSLLESCGTRGRAPYDALLTHGFTMDAKGMKMSKSLGNTINPLDLMRDYGADILRLWALSVDYTEDHRIGDEILKGVSDQYRKLRNTFRYMLGALEGFSDEERLDDVAQYPELDRYMLSLLAKLDQQLRGAVENFDFNSYTRALGDFCNNDLSAFYFDIRKDCLYCDAPSDPKRRAYRTVLNTLFQALVRWLAPVLVFTTEEVWATRYPDAGSVHLLEWPEVPEVTVDDEEWTALRESRSLAFVGIEARRNEKVIGSGLEADVILEPFLERHANALSRFEPELAELFIVASVAVRPNIQPTGGVAQGSTVTRTRFYKCGRCWRHLPEVTHDGALCDRCDGVVNA